LALAAAAAAEAAKANVLQRQLEAERLERARERAAGVELAEQMRVQAEELLTERAKMAQMNSNLTREKSGMQEIMEHQAQALEHTGDEADALAAELAEARAELEALRGKYG
jgi:EAL domain-containing protein (putative c-di-GMP-specific phosphodiesterase class I)